MEKPRKSFLMTPDPYHTPGYAGYVPQLKYRIGSTYGCHTHDLLSDGSVKKSVRSVLCDTWPPRRAQSPPQTHAPATSTLLAPSNRSWGDQKYTFEMIPGYTGFIPKGQNYFGSRYSELSRHAVNSFENDQSRHQLKMNELNTIEQRQKNDSERLNCTLAQNTTPLKPIADKAKPFLPAYTKQHVTSPFNLPNGHADKHFMSGYMGFVPRSEKYFGQGYPINTYRALAEFGEDERRIQDTRTKPFVLVQPSGGAENMGQSTLYPRNSGLIPHYTGHIPGQKFKFAGTFGSSTQDALPQIVN